MDSKPQGSVTIPLADYLELLKCRQACAMPNRAGTFGFAGPIVVPTELTPDESIPAAKPEAAKPEAAKPEAAKPEAAKPEAAKPPTLQELRRASSEAIKRAGLDAVRGALAAAGYSDLPSVPDDKRADLVKLFGSLGVKP